MSVDERDVGRRVSTLDGRRGWMIGHTVIPAAIIVTDSGEELTVRVDKATLDLGGACLPRDECLRLRDARSAIPERLGDLTKWLYSMPSRWADNWTLHAYDVADALIDLASPQGPIEEPMAPWEQVLLDDNPRTTP